MERTCFWWLEYNFLKILVWLSDHVRRKISATTTTAAFVAAHCNFIV